MTHHIKNSSDRTNCSIERSHIQIVAALACKPDVSMPMLLPQEKQLQDAHLDADIDWDKLATTVTQQMEHQSL